MRPVLPLLLLCLLAAAMPLLPQNRPAAAEPVTGPAFAGWPASWNGAALEPLPLSQAEQRFASGFPGRVAKFRAGSELLILRWISHETRLLHPAADCFKGMGYTVEPPTLLTDGQGRWGRFRASQGGQSVSVLEQLHDGSGQHWSDVSAWYWDALLGRSRGPWWSITRIVAEKRG